MKTEQLTAWALNELSADEQTELESLLNTDPEAQQQAAQTKSFCDFLTAELAADSLALTPEQRQRLLHAEAPRASVSPEMQRPTPNPKGQTKTWWRRYALANLAAAAAVAVLATWMLRTEVKEAAESRVLSYTLSESVQVNGPRATLRDEGSAVGQVGQVGQMRHNEVQKARKVSEESMLAGNVGNNANLPFGNVLRSDTNNSAARSGMEKAVPIGDAEYKVAEVKRRTEMLSMVTESWEIKDGDVAPAPPAPTAAQIAGTVASKVGVGPVALNETQIRREVTLPPGSVRVVKDAFANGSATRASKPMELGGESYMEITENKLTDVAQAPLSTFSIDVDTAAYANVRRFLNQNTAPPRDAVRVEELINYFPTNEDGPAANAKEPFAVKVEMAACPWQPQHRLARIAIKGREVGQDRQPSNLVFLVDVSGSMGEPAKLPLVQESLRLLTAQLGENDRVSMVTYAGGTQVVLPSTSGQQKADIMAAIDRLQSGGSTHGSAGIRLAYEQAVAGFIKGGVNRVMLCTDGDFNVGLSSPAELETYITEKARSDVFLSVLGYGTGNLKDRTMETLADKGNGNYAYIDSLSEARKVLVEQMNGTLVTIAKDVKIQVEFNPASVRSYRLIGYENRLLAKEDFNNDAKDAGEIGAGHSVTALYELVPANLPPGTEPRPPVDHLKYQQLASPPPLAATPAAKSGEALTVKLRYKEPEGTTSKLIEIPVPEDRRELQAAGAEFKFTAAVAAFGLMLRQSSYAGQLTWEQVRQLALAGKGSDDLGYRGEFIQLIEKARGVSR